MSKLSSYIVAISPAPSVATEILAFNFLVTWTHTQFLTPNLDNLPFGNFGINFGTFHCYFSDHRSLCQYCLIIWHFKKGDQTWLLIVMILLWVSWIYLVIPFNDVFSKSICQPREVLVDIFQEYPEDTEHTYIPSCVVLNRCGGCCSDEAMECVPTETHNVTLQVSLEEDQTLKNVLWTWKKNTHVVHT